MAANVQLSSKLGADDCPTEHLLLTVAKHVKYNEFNLLRLATDVGMAEGRFTQKTVPHSDARMKIVEVLRYWHQATAGLTVKDVIDRVKKWLKEDMIDREIWTSLQALVDCELPTASPQHTTEGAPSPCPELSDDRLQEIQRLTKESLREKPFSTAKGKIWTETPSSIPIEKIYTKLTIVKKNRETYGVETEELPDITQLLSHQNTEESGPGRFLVKAAGGMGKSTAMKHLALSWADGSADEMKSFDFVFHVALHDVQANQTMENIIIEQHKGLSGNNVRPDEIKGIIERHTKQKVLIIFDGHDEYKVGTNSSIDKAITKDYLRNCWVILTSRETKELPKIREYMDVEAEITGFDAERVEEYITKFLGSEAGCVELIEIARRSGIINFDDSEGKLKFKYGILRIPILLHMVCVLFIRKVSLAKTKTRILSTIVERCPDWEEIRKTGQKSVKDVKDSLIRLGKLALKKLQQEDFQQIFHKEEILREVGPEAFELGLLMGTESDPLEEEQTQVYCFHHLLILEFVAAKYVATLDKESLRELFPDWDSILKHHEILRFACGLTAETQAILDFVYETLLRSLLTEELDKDDVEEFMTSLTHEVSNEASTKVLNNKYINYIGEDVNVFVPSRFYVFDSGFKAIRYQVDHSSLAGCGPAECAINVSGSEEFLKALKIIKEISKYQQVGISSLNLENVNCNTKEETWRLLLDLVHSASQADTDDVQDGVGDDSMIRLLEDVVNTTYSGDSITSDEDISKLLLDMQQWENTEAGAAAERKERLNETIELMLNVLLNRSTKGDDVVNLILITLALSRNARLVRFRDCSFEARVFLHLASQLCGCNTVEKLSLINTVGVPAELGEALFTISSLKMFLLKDCQLSTSVSAELMTGLSNCRNLVSVDLRNNHLTGCLEKLFSGNHTGFPFLEQLYLEKTKLNEVDVLSINKAGRDGKVPKLKFLGLQKNQLIDQAGLLLGGSGHPLFPSLTGLWMQSTALNQNDISNISASLHEGRLPTLQHLNLSYNNLTNDIGHLFDGTIRPGYPFLTALTLKRTAMSKTDVVSLSKAAQEGKFLQLKVLDLTGVNLKDSVADLFGEKGQSGFSALERLYMEDARLSRADVHGLSDAVKSDKLPRLNVLSLKFNNLCTAEKEVENLIVVSVLHYARKVTLSLEENKLSEELCQRMNCLCNDSKVVLLTATSDKFLDWMCNALSI